MAIKNPIVHFEIPADNVARAIKFYETTFGWQITKYPLPNGERYWGVRTVDVDKDRMPIKPGAINGGLMKRKNKGQPFMNYNLNVLGCRQSQMDFEVTI